MAKIVSAAMLALGLALLLVLPLGGVLFLVAGGLGLAIASESPLGERSGDPTSTTP
ncbi:MAG TPA: hypothetical protein VFO65_11995 [Acidimicrobiales bacterium]|nr:hypothetical protein [Acidimicrobiales bacterium]